MLGANRITEKLYHDEKPGLKMYSRDKFSIIPKNDVDDHIHDVFADLTVLLECDGFREAQNLSTEECLKGRVYSALCLWIRQNLFHRLCAAANTIRANRDIGCQDDDVGQYEPVTNDSPVAIALKTELKTRVQSSIAALTPRQAAVITQRFSNGLEYSEISMNLGISVSAVKKSKARAIAKLKKNPNLDPWNQKEEE